MSSVPVVCRKPLSLMTDGAAIVLDIVPLEVFSRMPLIRVFLILHVSILYSGMARSATVYPLQAIYLYLLYLHRIGQNLCTDHSHPSQTLLVLCLHFLIDRWEFRFQGLDLFLNSLCLQTFDDSLMVLPFPCILLYAKGDCSHRKGRSHRSKPYKIGRASCRERE